MVETRRLTQLTSRLGELLDTPAGALVVALSGGADSAALAYLLEAADRRFRAVHVDHGLVGSPRLEKAARAVASRFGTPLDVTTVNVPAGPSPEGQARRVRYQALLSSLDPGEWLLTAHTLDDQAETVLLNLLRGGGAAGLAGIPRRSPPVARPLLEASRSETRELAALAGLPFFDDPANLDPANRRNVIRLDVLPDLSSRFNPRLAESLARAAALIGGDDELLAAEAGAIAILARGSSLAIPIGALHAVPRPVADRALRRCLARVRPPYSGTAGELTRIRAVASRGRESVTLEGGIVVAVEGPLLVFRRTGDSRHPSAPVDLEVGANTIDGFEVGVDRVDRVCRVAPLGTWSAIFAPGASLRGVVDEKGRLVVEADGEVAWVAGERRLAVAWYQPGTSGYLSVFAREESGWTSSP
jgi:tRNA(Ile)-lysidine synthase